LEKSQEEKILDAAYNVIAREGYAQTSLRQIAEEAQVALSQISYHYQNKEGLLLAVVRRVANRYSEFVQGLSPEMSPWEKGAYFIQLYQHVLTKEPELFRVLYDLVGLALWSEPLREQVAEIFQVIIDQFATEVFTGEVLQELAPPTRQKCCRASFWGASSGSPYSSCSNLKKQLTQVWML
jgi:AcrR family transcriptional regulator